MRDLDIQLTKMDIFHMMTNVRVKKKGMKESTKLAVMFLITLVSLVYMALRIKLWPLSLWSLPFDMLANLGFLAGLALIITVLQKIVQYFKVLKSPLMQKQQIHFGEHRIEIREENGNVSCYPYAAILFTEISKFQIHVYMKRIGNAKALLALPASAFRGAGEMELCLNFLQQKQSEDLEMDPLKQQREITSLQEEAFTFSFIQEEAEWIDVLAVQKYYLLHSKYIFKIPEGIITVFMLLLVAGIGMNSYFTIRNMFVLLVYSVFMILAFVIVYLMQFSRRAVLRSARFTAKRGFPVPRRVGRQVVTFNRTGIYFSSDSEQWNMDYDRIFTVLKTSREVFIFLKGGYFLNIPVWVFQSMEEEQQLLDYLEGKGIFVNRKEVVC